MLHATSAIQRSDPNDGFFSGDGLASSHGMRLQAVHANLPPHKVLIQAAVLAHSPTDPQLTPAPAALPCLQIAAHRW